jgi:hypothetical protein
MTTVTAEFDDPEFLALPADLQAAIGSWVNLVREADQQGAEILALAEASGVTQADIRAIARKQLVAIYKRTNAIPL